MKYDDVCAAMAAGRVTRFDMDGVSYNALPLRPRMLQASRVIGDGSGLTTRIQVEAYFGFGRDETSRVQFVRLAGLMRDHLHALALTERAARSLVWRGCFD